MLGRHADAFFAKQARERILANQPNGTAQSIAFPDRELAGTGQVSRVSGYYEVPGPQNVHSGNQLAGLPGMTGLPGMEGLPGMTGLPGMGALSTGTLIKWGAIAAGGLIAYGYWQKRKRRGARDRRSARIRAGGRMRVGRAPAGL
jgi:hypothetical protein